MEPLSILAGAYALGTTMYNMYQGYRQEVREDNAIQRRVADLQKAGLSPTLAAGSAAASVASPRAEGVNPVGAWIDAQNALEQLKQNRELTKQAKLATSEANRQNNLSKMQYMFNLGFRPTDYFYNSDEEYGHDIVQYSPDEQQGVWWRGTDFDNSPIMQMLRGNRQMYLNQLDESNLSRDMAQKENGWYNFNQGLSAVATGVGLGLNAFSTFGGHALKRRALDDSFQQFQQELTRKQNYDNWRMSPRTSYYSDNRGYRSSRVNY